MEANKSSQIYSIKAKQTLKAQKCVEKHKSLFRPPIQITAWLILH